MLKFKSLKYALAAGVMLSALPVGAAETITYSGWLGTYDKNADLIQQIKDKFKAKTGADLKIVDTAFDKALNQATVTTMAGNPADAIHLIAGWVPAVQGIGGLEPLDGYFSKEKLDTIPKALRDSVSVDGKLYALPWVPGPGWIDQRGFKPAAGDPRPWAPLPPPLGKSEPEGWGKTPRGWDEPPSSK